MIVGLQPYAAYRDTGMPWLGDLPEHWENDRLKNRVTNIVESADTRSADELYIALEHVESWTGRLRAAGPEIVFDSQVKRFKVGDVLFGKLRPYLAKVTRPPGNGVCVGEFFVLRPRDHGMNPGYVEQLLRSQPLVEVINSSTFGAKMPRAEWQVVGDLHVPCPPLPEQAAIVRFLDYADRQIRRYMNAKQKLIHLLEEEKQTVIQRTVLRGLDFDVRLKPSGVGWLGDIPEHWEVRRAKRLFREVDRRSATGTEVLLSLRMYQGLVPHGAVSVIPIPSENLIGFKMVDRGQIVMNRMRAAIGLFGIAPQSGLVSPDYAVLEPIEELQPTYFLLLFKTPAARSVFRSESKGLGTGSSGFMRLYTDRFSMIKLPVPPQQEQRDIVHEIALRTDTIDRTQERVTREVALLRAYRTRLTADVVTGKIDVREAAATLSDDTYNHEAFDTVGEPGDDPAELDEDTEAQLGGVEE